ncbi:hypothetical protein TEGL_19810 [Terrisporobacter glycolicus ATCC 14880 = DSM 1288]|uniref:Uncharacterized protein n=1 Tax=Terrisporobacter glycolicus ATCC 14880 = DSM 1288 TaxID=1121315 RepID=A0ABZ2EV68_9FIRM
MGFLSVLFGNKNAFKKIYNLGGIGNYKGKLK